MTKMQYAMVEKKNTHVTPLIIIIYSVFLSKSKILDYLV